MSVAIARKVTGGCRFMSKKGSRSVVGELRGTFPRGTYEIRVRARDGAGNREAAQTIVLRLR